MLFVEAVRAGSCTGDEPRFSTVEKASLASGGEAQIRWQCVAFHLPYAAIALFTLTPPVADKNPAFVCDQKQAMLNNFIPDLSKLSLVPMPDEIPRDPHKYPKLPGDAPPEVKVGILDVGGAYWSRANRMERFRLKKEEEKKYGKEKMKEAIAARAEKKKQLLKRLLA